MAVGPARRELSVELQPQHHWRELHRQRAVGHEASAGALSDSPLLVERRDWLENLGRILPKGGLAPVPFVASATFGPPLALGEGEAKDAFLARLRAAILALAADPVAGGLR